MNWQWLVILGILAMAFILAPSKDNEKDYRDYDCYDKSVYKCGKCKKKCKWRYIVENFERLEKEKES